ncbi:MAG: DUF6465 family protein, partial [Eubacterium sp.]|nr:DUF6465 family protein [Eubacterium sp.]
TTTKKAAAPAKKEAAKKTAAKAPAKKAATKAPAKKTTAKATTKAVKSVEKVVVEYAGGQYDTADIVAKAKAASGKKTVKELNVYFQPETGMIYFTADGAEGSTNL